MAETQTIGVSVIDALNPERITSLQREWSRRWHGNSDGAEIDTPWRFVEANHRMNFAIWHEEDIARRDDLGAERVRQAKRLIDKTNQARNDAIEEIDQWIAAHIPIADPGAALHSETPGMMIDRLSILALKLYHMREQAERTDAEPAHRETCARKAEILEIQLSDLRGCLETLLDQLSRGERMFRIYRQFKMYNDPKLNPQLYSSGGKA